MGWEMICWGREKSTWWVEADKNLERLAVRPLNAMPRRWTIFCGQSRPACIQRAMFDHVLRGKLVMWFKWWAFRVLLLLLLSRFSRVRLCVTPETAAHQAPPSLGFSRQEHWSGLPFPPPMHESEKWKWRRSVVSDSSRPHGLQPTRLLHPWDFPGKSTGVGCHCLLRGSQLGDLCNGQSGKWWGSGQSLGLWRDKGDGQRNAGGEINNQLDVGMWR